MRFKNILKCLYFTIFGLLVAALEHEKSFMVQESSSCVCSFGIHEDSLLLTVSNDIVQKDIHTGAIQRTFRAHKKAIYSLLVTNDSRMISSAYDDMIIAWDLETGSILKRIWLRSSDTLVKSIHFQDDQVFAGGQDGKVRQIDLVSGRVVKTISFSGQVLCVAAGSGSLFVGKTRSPTLVKLSIESGAVVADLIGHSTTVYSLFIWNNLLFSGSFDSTIVSWNTENAKVIQRYFGHSGSVYAVAVFDGHLYSSGSLDELFKWNTSTGQITMRFPKYHLNGIVSLAFRSQALFSGSYDNTLIKWDAVSGDILFLYAGRNSFIKSVVSWKNFVISGGDNAEIRTWDASIDSINPFAVLDNNLARIHTLYIFENLLYCGDHLSGVKELRLPSLTVIRTFEAAEAILSFAAKKLSLYGGGFYGSVYQWNMSTGFQIALFSAHDHVVTSLQLSDDILYSGSLEGRIKAWNTTSIVNFRIFDGSGQINAILIDQDLLIACTYISVERFSVISGERDVVLRETSGCLCVVSHGNIAYTGHDDSFVKSRDLYSLNVIATYAGHTDWVAALCFDESFNLFSAGFDGSVKKWNMASRSVAFSFENRNGSVSSLAVNQNELYVGLKSGRIDIFNIENSMALKSLLYNSEAITSLTVFNGSVYFAGFDGTVRKLSSRFDQNFTTVYKSDGEPLKDLSLGSFLWIALQGDTNIILIPLETSSESVKVIDFEIPLVCVAATDTVIIAGSKSGIIYAWDSKTLQLAFEMKGHVSPVNDLLVIDDRLFSASDDKTIIEWSLDSKTRSQTFQRLSTSALGHLGPVKSLSYCSDTLFYSGSDLTVRRWNAITGKHDDVYFGFTKSVTSVLCQNGSVFAGSEDFSVLMFKPNLPQSQDAISKSTSITMERRITQQKKIVRIQRVEASSLNTSFVLVSASVALALIILVIWGYVLLKKRSKEIISPPASSATMTGSDSIQTLSNFETIVNSVMGISKHAAYLIENSSLAKVKKIASGGGGEVFLAKVMDPSLRRKHGETVIQKIVFVKSKASEEAFYQEVGIMILLNSFPNFCQIIGYTEKPLSMILKNYPHGSLQDWLGRSNYGTSIALKMLKETALALNVMHSHYLAHCDLKPQNILMEVDNGLPSCYLTDFGITQILSEKIIATKTFHVINLRGLSTHYAAPEAFRNFRTKQYVKVDFKAYDVYSFGCITYKVLTGKTPWH